MEVVTALGPPSKSEAAQMVYSHDGKLADGFDETAWLILRFREEKLGLHARRQDHDELKWLLSEAEYDEALWKKDSKVKGFN